MQTWVKSVQTIAELGLSVFSVNNWEEKVKRPLHSEGYQKVGIEVMKEVERREQEWNDWSASLLSRPLCLQNTNSSDINEQLLLRPFDGDKHGQYNNYSKKKKDFAIILRKHRQKSSLNHYFPSSSEFCEHQIMTIGTDREKHDNDNDNDNDEDNAVNIQDDEEEEEQAEEEEEIIGYLRRQALAKNNDCGEDADDTYSIAPRTLSLSQEEWRNIEKLVRSQHHDISHVAITDITIDQNMIHFLNLLHYYNIEVIYVYICVYICIYIYAYIYCEKLKKLEVVNTCLVGDNWIGKTDSDGSSGRRIGMKSHRFEGMSLSQKRKLITQNSEDKLGMLIANHPNLQH
ncbi:hypothetical protein RFI_18779, partial [Reticulomyxa filosa]